MKWAIKLTVSEAVFLVNIVKIGILNEVFLLVEQNPEFPVPDSSWTQCVKSKYICIFLQTHNSSPWFILWPQYFDQPTFVGTFKTVTLFQVFLYSSHFIS